MNWESNWYSNLYIYIYIYTECLVFIYDMFIEYISYSKSADSAYIHMGKAFFRSMMVYGDGSYHA